jgi:hypothetical protein
MGSVLAFRNKKQHEVSKRFLACVSPCLTYWVDHINNNDPDLVSRITIEKTQEQFFVNHYQARLETSGVPKKMRASSGFSFECHAIEKVEEIVTCLELENWDFLQENHLIIYDVKNHAGDVEPYALDFNSIFEFQFNNWKEDFVLTRPLPNGVHAICTLDPYGKIKISTVRGNRHIELDDSGMFNMLKRVDGAKGFVSEGIYDGAIFWVTDVHYLHDQWIRDMPYIAREKFVKEYLSKHDITLPRLGMNVVRRMALDTMLGNVVKGVIAYTQDNKRCALSSEKGELYWFEAEYDDGYKASSISGKELGFVKGFGRLKIEHAKFIVLSHTPAELGANMVLI